MEGWRNVRKTTGLSRCKVPGGWLYKQTELVNMNFNHAGATFINFSLCFVPDPKTKKDKHD